MRNGTASLQQGLGQSLEYWGVRAVIAGLGRLPRPWALRVGECAGWAACRSLRRLRATGERNLVLAFPESEEAWRQKVLRGAYRSLGRQLAEFCRMPGYTPENTQSLIRYKGLAHWQHAAAKGKGVLIVTGHLGAWELSSYYHSLMGHPMSMVIRRLDNPRLDALVNRIRCRHGNRVLPKDDFARGLLGAVREGGSVGVLMDTNMTPPQGVFVPFFGIPACTGSGVARIAAKTGAAVLPGFLLWHEGERRYVLRFYPELAMQRTADAEADAVENTRRCTAAIEAVIRAYPEQWLWVHRRWKTRPPGEPSIY